MEEEALPANFSQLEEKEEEEDDPEEPRRHHHHHFVLVHGVGHGGWCWYKVRSLLQGAGHKVSCVDLASAGIDRADPNLVRSIEEYDAPLFHLLSALPDHHKVVLVGHSAGGLSVTHALHAFRSRIKLAIYLAATMLPWGFQTQEDVKDGVPNLSRFGDVYELSFNLGPRNPPTCVALKKKIPPPNPVSDELNPGLDVGFHAAPAMAGCSPQHQAEQGGQFEWWDEKGLYQNRA